MKTIFNDVRFLVDSLFIFLGLCWSRFSSIDVGSCEPIKPLAETDLYM